MKDPVSVHLVLPGTYLFLLIIPSSSGIGVNTANTVGVLPNRCRIG